MSGDQLAVRTKVGSKKLADFVNGDNATFGAANGTGVTAENELAGVNKTVLTFVNTPIVLADNAAVVAFGSLKIFDMPQGSIVILGATANLVLTKSSAGVIATFDGDFGLGTTAADNTATLSSTEQNIIPTTATPQAVAGVSSMKGRSTAITFFDGTTTAIDVYLNALVDDADHDVTTTPCNLIVNGTITLVWSNLGDY
jgi:hypothetical protein